MGRQETKEEEGPFRIPHSVVAFVLHDRRRRGKDDDTGKVWGFCFFGTANVSDNARRFRYAELWKSGSIRHKIRHTTKRRTSYVVFGRLRGVSSCIWKQSSLCIRRSPCVVFTSVLGCSLLFFSLSSRHPSLVADFRLFVNTQSLLSNTLYPAHTSSQAFSHTSYSNYTFSPLGRHRHRLVFVFVGGFSNIEQREHEQKKTAHAA